MARTRAQGPADENDHTEAPATKRQKLSATKKESAKQKGTPQDAPEALPKERQQSEKEEEASEYAEAPKSGNNSELQHLLSKCGALPLADCNIDVTTSKPDVLLALVFNAMLSSARISHELAYKSVKRLIEAGYHDVATLKKSSWQERTEVLTEGGYTRYREKTATALGELADLVTVKYGCDLNNLLKAAESKPAKIRKSLEEIKQFGKVGVDIFCDTAQAAWPCLAPFIDPRSMKTAQTIGVGNDVAEFWEDVGKDPVQMCRLSTALTTVRLEKREGEFT